MLVSYTLIRVYLATYVTRKDMDFPILFNVIYGEYYNGKYDAYSCISVPKCRRTLLPPVLRYVLIILGLHAQCTRHFQGQPSEIFSENL